VRRSILLAGLALAGCEVYSVPAPAECPGTNVGRFDLALQYAADAGGSLPACPATAVANTAFAVPATLAFQPDGGAAICLQRAHAVPFYGAHVGDHVRVSNVDPAAPVNVCTCLVVVVNEIEGDVVRDADGGFVTFTSRWLSTLTAPDGGAGDAGTQDGGVCGCGLPCQVLYTPDGGP
jgi:hypothetical protein